MTKCHHLASVLGPSHTHWLYEALFHSDIHYYQLWPAKNSPYWVANDAGVFPTTGTFLLFFFLVKFYYWLHWVFDVAHRPFITVCGLSLAVVSRGYCLAVGRGLLLAVAFLVLEHRLLGFSSCSTRTQLLWRMGLTAPLHVESSWTRDWTSVPCADRQILNHWTTRKVLK